MNSKKLINKLGLFILKFGERVFQVPDIAKAEKRGERLTTLLYWLDKKHRNQTVENLKLAFPEKSDQERKEIGREMYRHFGRVIADFMRSPIRTEAELREGMEVENRQIYDRLVADGKGILLITAHFGNWERYAHWFRLSGVTFSSVARDADDNEITAHVNKIRELNGMDIISRGNAAREMIRRLRQGQMVGMLPDQNDSDCFIPFFGHTAGTVLGPAVLHIKTGAPLLPSCCIRTGPGKYKAYVFEPITVLPDETPEELMTRVNAAIETMIRLAPEQYLWMHDRWRNARRKGLL